MERSNLFGAIYGDLTSPRFAVKVGKARATSYRDPMYPTDGAKPAWQLMGDGA